MWTGTGKKLTEPFKVSGKWRIAWSYTSGGSYRNMMEVVVMRSGSDDKKDIAVRIPNGEGSSDVVVENKTGQFSLLMNCAAVDWTVSVEELRG